jgi:hypothetical protein
MVGRVPLIPLFLAGNTTPTIPHKYSQHQRSGFPVGICDSAAEDGRRGSNAYEVKRLVPRRRQLRRSGSCAEQRLADVARLIGNDGK